VKHLKKWTSLWSKDYQFATISLWRRRKVVVSVQNITHTGIVSRLFCRFRNLMAHLYVQLVTLNGKKV